MAKSRDIAPFFLLKQIKCLKKQFTNFSLLLYASQLVEKPLNKIYGI